MAQALYRRIVIAVLSVALIALLSACNMPGRGAPTESGVGVIYTAAARTVEAQLTELSRPPVTPVGLTPLPPTIPGGTSSPASTAVPATAGPTSAASACDRAEFVEDVTVPDNTQVAPGATFVKTWRLRNAGTCTWNPDYRLVFSSGDALGAPDASTLTTRSVPPGETVDISLTLKAPDQPGSYRGEWKMSNASNAIFGVGRDAKPFWVQIQVGAGTAASNGFDFLARSPEAQWRSGAGGSTDISLTFGGTEADANGAAALVSSVRLETGATSGKVLLTIPKHEDNGVITGVFPAYTVRAGDRFKARLGFASNPNGSCGAAQVVFQLGYLSGGTVQSLQEWSKGCDGRLMPVDVNLGSLRGQTVQFIFTVSADGSIQDDRAIWNSPIIQ